MGNIVTKFFHLHKMIAQGSYASVERERHVIVDVCFTPLTKQLTVHAIVMNQGTRIENIL